MKQKDQQIDLHIDNGDLLDNNLNLLADTIENFATRNPKDIANEFINKL
jgi:translation initiation factor 3 subunit L